MSQDPILFHAPSGRWTSSDGQAVVAAWRASGQGRAAWCRAHAVALHRLTYWIGRLLPMIDWSPSTTMSFAEVRCAPQSHAEALTVLCGSGARVLVPRGVDVVFLRAVAEALS